MSTTDLVAREGALVTTARTLALAVLEDHRVKTALNVAQNTKGVVITNDAEASIANDQLAALIAGEKLLAAGVKRVTDIGEAIKRAAKGSVAEQSTAISGAVVALKGALQSHLARQRAAAEAERVRIENERRERDRLAAESLVEEEAPPLEEAPPPVPKRVVSGSGQAHLTSTLQVESVNFHEWDPSWARLDSAAAKAEFRVMLQRGDVEKPGDASRPVVYRGAKFWYEEGLAHSGIVGR